MTYFNWIGSEERRTEEGEVRGDGVGVGDEAAEIVRDRDREKLWRRRRWRRISLLPLFDISTII